MFEENPESSSKRKLSSDESVVESANEQIDKRKKLRSENEEIEENTETSGSEQAASNEESNLSEDNDKVNTTSDVSSRQTVPFEPECKRCHKKFFNPRTYYEHIESPSHKRKQNPLQRIECKICEKSFLGKATFDQHAIGKNHQKKLLAYELREKFKVDRASLPTKEEASAKKGPIFCLRCQVCNKKFSGLISYDLHMSSPAHSKMVEKATLEKIASCAICNLTFSGLTSYEVHMSSPLHMKNVQQARTASYGNYSSVNNSDMQNN